MKTPKKLDELLKESQRWQGAIRENDFEAVIPELEEHSIQLRRCIQSIEDNPVSQSYLDNLARIIEQHRMSIELINQRKNEISKKLLGLRNGRSLAHTYNHSAGAGHR